MADGNRITDALRQYFGFEKFKGQQQEIISDLIDGKDVFVLMPTGGGKSLCYQLPALMSEGTAIIISPLIALMKNQVDAIRQHSADDGIAHFMNSSLGKGALTKVLKDIREGRTKLLYVAPESLTKQSTIDFLKTIKISFYAVDEAHCISEWGHDFRPEYRRIRNIINAIYRRPLIALTATATPKVQHDIQKNLGMSDAKVYKSSFNRPNLYYEIRPKTKDVNRDVIRYIKSNPGKSGIVYCLSRKTVEDLANILRLNDIKVHAYHAGLDAATRARHQDDFLMEKVDVIVATIAFGMGIDKPDVRYVIHYDIPKSLEGYYQETGRGGRDGGEGRCIAFYSTKDLQKLDKLLQGKNPGEQEIGRQLLIETAHYAESSVCRRKILLSYFGERLDGEAAENCGNCDNCLHPKTRVEAGIELRETLRGIIQLGERYKSEYIVAFLTGRSTEEGRQHNHDSLEAFGALSDVEANFLNDLIQQAIIAGYIANDMDNYGILHVTPTGHQFILEGGSFEIVEGSDFSDIDFYDGRQQSTGAVDNTLLNILKDLRRSIARRLNVPPYVILQDPVLESLATFYPVEISDFAGIAGVGTGKAMRFGKEFTDVIADYVVENDVFRPTDIHIRNVADPGKTKVYIIQSIDRKIDLGEIADAKGLEFDELLTIMEGLVAEGTRINIDYYLDDILEDECQEEIIDFFKSLEEDDIEAAIQELGEDYTEEELRLMRIRFLSMWA